jgi:hypothetical protein
MNASSPPPPPGFWGNSIPALAALPSAGVIAHAQLTVDVELRLRCLGIDTDEAVLRDAQPRMPLRVEVEAETVRAAGARGRDPLAPGRSEGDSRYQASGVRLELVDVEAAPDAQRLLRRSRPEAEAAGRGGHPRGDRQATAEAGRLGRGSAELRPRRRDRVRHAQDERVDREVAAGDACRAPAARVGVRLHGRSRTLHVTEEQMLAVAGRLERALDLRDLGPPRVRPAAIGGPLGRGLVVRDHHVDVLVGRERGQLERELGREHQLPAVRVDRHARLHLDGRRSAVDRQGQAGRDARGVQRRVVQVTHPPVVVLLVREVRHLEELVVEVLHPLHNVHGVSFPGVTGRPRRASCRRRWSTGPRSASPGCRSRGRRRCAPASRRRRSPGCAGASPRAARGR